MKLDSAMPTYDLNAVAQSARALEGVGYDCIWTSETQHEPFLPLAVAASATSSIKLGTSIAVAFPRSPMVLAHTAWDLQRGSHGRFILGLGSQVKAHNERRFSVKFEAPGPRLREVVLALRAIWDCWQNGTPLNFRGEFYRFDLMTPFFNPGPIDWPRIPVYMAAVNRWMCHAAGEVCDGIHVHPFHSARYIREWVQPAVQEGLKAAGRSRQEFTYATATFAVTGETEAERARNALAVKRQIAFYASTRTYQPILAVHGWGELTGKLHRKSIEGDWDGMATLITDEMLDVFAVSGSYAELGTRLRERYNGLIDRTALYQPYPIPSADPRLTGVVRELNR